MEGVVKMTSLTDTKLSVMNNAIYYSLVVLSTSPLLIFYFNI